MDDPQKLKEAKAKYDAQVEKVLKKIPERKPEFVNTSGIPVARLYTPLDMQEFDYLKQLGMPGQYPYTRAVQPTAYRGRFWTMRQYAGFGTAEETNERYHFLLKSGQTGLSVAFDLPTQIGYDSDHELAQGEVGKVGVAIDSLWDMERLFQGIPLDQVSTSMTINSPCAVILAMYLAVAEKQGVSFDKLRGTVQNDILKEYPARGTYIFGPSNPCASSPTFLPSAPSRCPSGTPSASAAITSVRPAPPRCRKWPSPWPTASLTWRRPWPRASRWMSSGPGSPSSSTPTWISWKKSPSSGPPGACGPRS